MNRSESKLTKRLLDQTRGPASGETFLWDCEVRGFGVRISKNSKRFFVQRQVTVGGKRKTRQESLGKYGIYTVAEARELAKAQIKRFEAGLDLDPAAEKFSPSRHARTRLR